MYVVDIPVDAQHKIQNSIAFFASVFYLLYEFLKRIVSIRLLAKKKLIVNHSKGENARAFFVCKRLR